MFAEGFEGLLETDAWPWTAIWPGIAFEHAVCQADIEWIEIELDRHFGDGGLNRHRGLLRTGSAIRASTRFVGDDFVAAQVHVREAVVAAEQNCRDLHWRGRTRSRVKHQPALQRGKRSVLFRAELDTDLAGRSRITAR